MAIIEASIPLFFLLILLELLVARRRGHRVHRLADSIADLSCGILSRLTGLATGLLTVAIHAWVVEHAALQRWGLLPTWVERLPWGAGARPGPLGTDWAALGSWALAFVLVDLAYYVMHRYSHTVHVLWAGHVVHHSSEEYNLTVALRQSGLHGLLSWIFYVPLAVLGMPWQLFASCYALNLVYQFWIHTREIDRLPRWLEWWLNTPSHHRVHHGVNPAYQDRNYAGVFIVWDRLFGTFVEERETPVYGITTPLRSWNPVWANVHVFAAIARDARRTRRWRDKVRVVLGHPGWRPADLAAVATPAPAAWPAVPPPFDPPAPSGVPAYALVQFVMLLAVAYRTLVVAPTLALHETASLVFLVALGLASIAALLEGRRAAPMLESARLAAVAVACAALLVVGAAPLLPTLGLAACVVSLAWLVRLRRRFDPLPVTS